MGDIIARGMSKKGLRNSIMNTHDNPYFRKYTPTIRETFGDLTRWVPTGATVEDDTVNYACAGIDKREDASWVATTGHAMKMTKTSTTGTSFLAKATLASAIDLTGQHAVMRFFIHEGSGDSSYDTISDVILYMYDAAGKYSYWSDVGLVNVFQPGWRTLTCRVGDNNDQSGFDITQVKYIQVCAHTKTNSQVPVITFDFVDFFPKIAAPIPYVITMDGGYINQKAALAYLAARGIKAHLYATYDWIGTSASYMTMDDLRQVQQMGHYVDIHERGALPQSWNTLTQSQKEQSLEEGLAWKKENGFLQGRGFATLQGYWWQDLDTLFSLPYLEHARISNAKNLVPYNPRLLGVAYDTNSLTVEAEATARAAAISKGTFYVGLVHGLLTEFTLANFKTIIDAAIADTDIRFVTIPELLNTNWYIAH